MTARTRLRGQPVVVLAILLGGWVALRATFWQSPFAEPLEQLPEALLASAARAGEAMLSPAANAIPVRRQKVGAKPSDWPVDAAPPAPPAAAPIEALPATDLPDPLRPKLVPFQPAPPMPQRVAAAHNAIFLSGLASIPIPPELEGLFARPASKGTPYTPLSTFVASPTGGRWSGDAWLLLRRDSATALAPGQGSYGRSQAGGVLRFSIAPSSPFRPMAYARLSQALGGAQESEFALGVSARPLPQVPVRAAAEMRVTQTGGRTLVRPAAYAVTELAPFDLPLGFTAEAYGQVGYVGGDFASAFADGQVRAERKLAELGDTKLSAGGGAWGGAQKGAARLDIGPSASVQLKLGETSSRVSMDWRFRVAGDARPASGPALTVSAGF